MKHLANFTWLTIVWVTLWEIASWANVLGGIAVALAVMALVPPKNASTTTGLKPLHAAKLAVYFLWELVKASLIVTWEVVTPGSTVRTGVVSVPLTSKVPGLMVAVANMVSLTPGTLTVEADEDSATLYIHVMHLKSREETRGSVQTLERLTLAAFPPRMPSVDDREEESFT